MKNTEADQRLTRIEKRAIEALAVVPIIREAARRLGREEAMAILEAVNREEAFRRGRQPAEDTENDPITALVKATRGELLTRRPRSPCGPAHTR
ncbi:hypothetical protein ACFL59_02245 [Planctomycetota bacterium]